MSFAANMYLYLGEGFVICITNMTLLWCVLSDHRNRRRREFILVAAQSVADSFYAIAFMMIAHLRLGLYYSDSIKTTVSTSDCAFIPALWLHNIATPLLGLLPLTSSFNFLLCSVAPLWYMRAGHNYTFLLLLVPFSITALLVFGNALVMQGVVVPISALCIAANGAANHIIYHVMLFFRIAANLGSAIIYAIILIYLKKSHGGSLKDLSPQQLKMHRNAKITLGLVTTNSIILLFFPDILLFLNPFNITKTYSTPLYSMTLSKTMINFAIYMARYRELRNIILLKCVACLPERLSTHVSSYIRSINEQSQVHKSFVTRSSIQPDKFSMSKRTAASRKSSSISNSPTNKICPSRPMDPVDRSKSRPNRLPPIAPIPEDD